MQMYKVKGADGAEYGPVSDALIRQWIAEGRLNGESLVSAGEAEDWRPLRNFPEFMASIAAVATAGMAPPPTDGREPALAATKTPGLLLVIFGALMALITLVGMAASLVGGNAAPPQLPPETPEWLRNIYQMQTTMPKWVSYVQFGVSAIVDAVIILGGLHLMRLRNRGLAVAGAILACLPCFTSCCCVLGLPLGIWAIMVINRPDVRPHFEA